MRQEARGPVAHQCLHARDRKEGTQDPRKLQCARMSRSDVVQTPSQLLLDSFSHLQCSLDSHGTNIYAQKEHGKTEEKGGKHDWVFWARVPMLCFFPKERKSVVSVTLEFTWVPQITGTRDPWRLECAREPVIVAFHCHGPSLPMKKWPSAQENAWQATVVSTPKNYSAFLIYLNGMPRKLFRKKRVRKIVFWKIYLVNGTVGEGAGSMYHIKDVVLLSPC